MVISGACLLVRTRPFAFAGGFDERMFLYFEEVTLKRRYLSAGYRGISHVAVKALVSHKGRATTDSSSSERKNSMLTRYHTCRSAAIYVGSYDGRFLVPVVVSRLGYALFNALAGRGGSAAMRGLVSGLICVAGRRRVRSLFDESYFK
jgi:GT2 family glycosyltransferase